MAAGAANASLSFVREQHPRASTKDAFANRHKHDDASSARYGYRCALALVGPAEDPLWPGQTSACRLFGTDLADFGTRPQQFACGHEASRRRERLNLELNNLNMTSIGPMDPPVADGLRGALSAVRDGGRRL